MSDEMDEIWALYADDGAQALDGMETALLALQAAGGGDPAGHVAALFRAVHTFKGNSRVLGLAVVESRAHLAEDLIGLVRDSGVPLDDEIVEILLLTADTLRVMLQETATTRADVTPARSETLMDRLRDKIARCKGEVPPADAAPPSAPPPSAPAAAATEAPEAVSERPADEAPCPAATPPSGARMIDDPAYRAIFLGMTADTRAALQAALAGGDAAPGAVRRSVDGLAHAARQLGLAAWASLLERFLALPEPGPDPIAALLLDLDGYEQADFGATAPPPPEDAGFLETIGGALSELAMLGVGFGTDADHLALRQAVIGRIVAAAEAHGYVRVTEAARALLDAPDRAGFREGELRLYEQLSAVESTLDGQGSPEISPTSLLLNWCADHVFDSLAELSDLLETMRKGTVQPGQFPRFAALMRRVHHACRYYRIDTAAQLSMSILDLFSRQHVRGGQVDPILHHIAQGFVSTMELVFDGLTDGEDIPQGETLETLLAEASDMAFAAEGAASAATIERRLGLPPEFRRVLSPESTRTAAEAMAEGLRFHIIRADINTDDALAEAFVLWLGGHGTRGITNVTVFRGTETLFDFLIATPLTAQAVTEALAGMDGARGKLRLLQTLTLADDAAGAPAESAPPAQAPGISAGMLERIGEIATGQAMIRQMQQDLADDDTAPRIEALLRAAGTPAALRAEVRALLTGRSDRLREISELEGQLLAQMALLQEEAASLRSRPADVVLQPAASLIRALADRAGRPAEVTTLGGELALDLTVLDTLRGILRALVQARVGAAGQARSWRLVFRRSDDIIQTTLEDDDPAPLGDDHLRPVAALVAQARGRLRQVAVPGGAGTRIHLSLPVSMVVIDGMVVRIGAVRYVLPVETISTILQATPGAAFDIAAERGQRMLRLPSQDVIPVHMMGSGPVAETVHVVLSAGGRRVALPVDEVIGQQMVLLRPLRGVLGRLNHLTGIALLAGGEVGMVLSAATFGGAEAA